MTAREKIMARLEPAPQERRKNISVKLPEDKLKAIEAIAAAITKKAGKRVSRNMLIEDAIEAFILDFQEEGGKEA